MSCEETRPKLAGQCGPCSPATRNRYFRGKLLTVSDYQAEQGYMVGRRRLVNRAMLGWGIVSGFALTLEEKTRALRIGRGVALDPCGREVVACEAVELASARDVIWLAPGKCGLEAHDPPKERPTDLAGAKAQEAQPRRRNVHYLLAAHYAECPIDGVRVDNGCGAASCEANHLCETVVYSLTQVTDCPPGLPECRECRDGDGPPAPEPIPEQYPPTSPAEDRGPQDRLCTWSENWLGNFDPCNTHKLCRVGCLYVDLDAGVPLACVTVDHDKCNEPYVAGIVETCRTRRLARPNELLFDLIRGCDLVRIQDVGWRDWLKPPFMRKYSDFANMFHKEEPKPLPPGQGQSTDEPVDTKFEVWFSGPVRASSLTPDVITMTLIQPEGREQVGDMVRVPITGLAIAPTTSGDPKKTTRSFRPLVDPRFWYGEINPRTRSAFEQSTGVEIEIRCDFIVDHLGQMVAGGGRFPPSRGTTPGGRFLSSFTVVPDKDWPQPSVGSNVREA